MATARKPPQVQLVRAAIAPPDFEDAVSWAAWLYYADQLTQSEIAGVLKLSRASVVKLLQEARERGVVTIRLNTDLASRTQLSRNLAKVFGLDAVTVIPALDAASLTRRLGDAAARALTDQLQTGDVIGVAWGRTVLSAARQVMLPEGVVDLTVVQVTGSSAGGTADFSPELCSSLLASRLGARCANLLAPAVLSTAMLRDQLLEEPALVRQFALIRKANRVLFGIGDLGPQSTLRVSELAGSDVIDAYVADGAVSAVLGQFIDEAGERVDGVLDGRMIGLGLDELRSIPVRLCVAGGREKLPAIRATLRGAYVTHLVTDMETGEALLGSD